MYYKLVIAYDGTDFQGWQRQQYPIVTVAQVLEDTFEDVFFKKIVVVGASRTDAGVHAAGQVAHCRLDFEIDPERLRKAWNNRLPASIFIRSITRDDNFHCQHDVEQKTYFYHVFTQRPLPFISRFGWYYRHDIDMNKLQESLQVFVGTHDFRAFCTLDEDKEKDTVRTINSIDVKYIRRLKAYRIIVRGPSFLHFMIRRIVGACIEVASRPDLPICVLNEALASLDPHQILPKAPAQGLILYKIVYKK